MAETLDVEIINSVLTIAEREYADRAKYFEGILALNPRCTGGRIAEYEQSAKRNRAHESQCRLLAAQLPALLSSRSDAERLDWLEDLSHLDTLQHVLERQLFVTTRDAIDAARAANRPSEEDDR